MKRYPSEDDYNKGFFIRYFSRRIKSTGYQEIDKEVYDSITKKDKKYDHNLYEIGNIIGKTLNRNIDSGESIKWADLI